MKLALDRWYELWEEVGSRGLDTWNEPPGEKTTYPRVTNAGLLMEAPSTTCQKASTPQGRAGDRRSPADESKAFKGAARLRRRPLELRGTSFATKGSQLLRDLDALGHPGGRRDPRRAGARRGGL
jgi:hypothetical protein